MSTGNARVSSVMPERVKLPFWQEERNLEAVERLKERYARHHPLIIHRSLERATGLGDLFDILESVPADLPIVWDEEKRVWRKTEDLFQTQALVGKEKEPDVPA